MKLELFIMKTCPYCKKVMNFIDKRDITGIDYLDINKDAEALERLVKIGGMRQVPCLFIDGSPMYESDDIINWLSDNCAAK